MAESLSTSRLEAFSDGVFAVIITIMVLELKVPSIGTVSDRQALLENGKIGVIYLLSFIQVGIYWVNHHYLLDDLETVSHGILWANLASLFCLSFIPFGLEWIGSRGIQPVPVVIYASCFFLPSVAWLFLAAAVQQRTHIPPAAGFAQRIFSGSVNLLAVAVAFRYPWTALFLIALVAVLWLKPPKRILEKTRELQREHTAAHHSS